jgi:subtilisin family serine protease
MNIKKLRFCLLPLIVSTLAACDSGSGDNRSQACAETGAYACQTGETEPLYTFQWALNYAASYFKDFPDVFGGGLDLNVEPVHRMGIKGQGVNVLVLDTGTDLHNEDLAPNADYSMSWNFVTKQDDPYPDLNADGAAHGTVVAGIIAAAQNGKGVMGIAPRARIGGANYLSGQSQVFAAYGGAPWSSKADIFNASFGGDTVATPYESDIENDTTTALRGIKKLREGKGAIFIEAAGNSFSPGLCGRQAAYFDCTNPANDVSLLESNVITVAALDAKGQASSYSSAGSVVWVTGMGGEYGGAGNYGEGSQDGDGPTIFSTDLRGCIYGFSYTGAKTPFQRGQTVRNGRPDNPDCDYTYMNGTSAATPTITGVVALMLNANPALTWRDVRDILRISARKVDADYIHHIPRKGDKPYGALEDLATNQPTSQMGSAADIRDGSTAFPMDLGWQKNAAGYEYSNWYGFGVPDTEKAVELARQYKNDPSLSRAKDVQVPDFSEVAYWQLNPLTGTESSNYAGVHFRDGAFPYQRVTSLGTFKASAQTVDQLQVRLSGEDVCLGSLGIAAKSPSGTVSLLKLPNDHFKANGINSFNAYTLGSFAFYGEQAKGDWELFAIASNPDTQIEVTEIIDNQVHTRLSTACPSTNGGAPIDFKLLTEARIIAQ